VLESPGEVELLPLVLLLPVPGFVVFDVELFVELVGGSVGVVVFDPPVLFCVEFVPGSTGEVVLDPPVLFCVELVPGSTGEVVLEPPVLF